LKFMNQEQLLKDKYLKMVLIDKDIKRLLRSIENYQPPEIEKWLVEEKS